MSHAAPSESSHTDATAPFARILCGVNGGRPARHAVEQALALAGSSAHVHFVAVCDVAGVGATRTGTLSVGRGKEALAIAHEQARDAGVDATTTLVHHTDASRHLIALAADHDLLVLGSAGRSRATTIAIGGTAGLAAHTAAVPVLVARAAAPGGPIVAATGADAEGRHVVEIAARLAGTRPLVLVHASSHDGGAERHELGVEAAAALERTGRDPVVVSEHDHPVDLILRTAHEDDASLIVIGSRGRTGLRALGSVSERVSARAGCSVLVLRAGGEA